MGDVRAWTSHFKGTLFWIATRFCDSFWRSGGRWGSRFYGWFWIWNSSQVELNLVYKWTKLLVQLRENSELREVSSANCGDHCHGFDLQNLCPHSLHALKIHPIEPSHYTHNSNQNVWYSLIWFGLFIWSGLCEPSFVEWFYFCRFKVWNIQFPFSNGVFWILDISHGASPSLLLSFFQWLIKNSFFHDASLRANSPKINSILVFKVWR